MAPRVEAGILFPKKDGRRSTQGFGRQCIGAALEPLSAVAAESARNARNWRWGYVKHFEKMVSLSCKSSDAAYASAEAGLGYVSKNFEFVRAGKTMTLMEGMRCTEKGYFSAKVEGTAKPYFAMPYKGQELNETEIASQLDRWTADGVIEQDAGDAVKSFLHMSMESRRKLFTEYYFCMLGAGSAMGPFELLMKLGATVVAIDLDRPHIWKRLVTTAKRGAGTLIFPTSKPQAEIATDAELYSLSGTNLITHTPEIANWLVNAFTDRKLLIGAYAYLNGELFVRVSVAMDAIIQNVIDKRKNLPAIAYLCTPTNLHCVRKEAYCDATIKYENRALWKSIFGLLGKNFLKRGPCDAVETDDGYNMTFENHVSAVQGPNYLLAKRIQIWRSILAKREGCIVSSNVAPSTATISVTQNKSIALAYKGMHNFGIEVFQQSTTNALMTALLLNDLMDEASPANPAVKLPHPLELQARNACHGGAQRCGEGLGTIGEAAAALYILNHPAAIVCYIVALVTVILFFNIF